MSNSANKPYGSWIFSTDGYIEKGLTRLWYLLPSQKVLVLKYYLLVWLLSPRARVHSGIELMLPLWLAVSFLMMCVGCSHVVAVQTHHHFVAYDAFAHPLRLSDAPLGVVRFLAAFVLTRFAVVLIRVVDSANLQRRAHRLHHCVLWWSN